MSSTYSILCLSHDPAIVATDPGYNQPEQAEEAIRAGVDGHASCDLLIGRYSYPLVEVGCPPRKYQPGKPGCCHSGATWVDSDWLRLLAAAHRSEDEAVRAVTGQPEFRCWPWERLRRLRDELGITVKEDTP